MSDVETIRLLTEERDALKAKVEELVEASLAQHDEWNGLMNAYHELHLVFNRGRRCKVTTSDINGITLHATTWASPSECNATLLLDKERE